MAKKFFYFFMICAYVLGVIGGFSYLVYYGQYVIAVGIIACGYMGLFKFQEYIKKMMA